MAVPKCCCGHQWNTFETAGKYPSCTKSWKDTMCPGPHFLGGCGRWSKHVDWYRNLDENFKEEMGKSFRKIST